ncbi:hypothetical protein DPMN_146751 [Dreissena polymorpha]|uniref:ShKT domain-containing protein n=1 Tax=Dreissena polymorpha TaxID=45954 RepID=A0A9D4FAW7_DREPO|nr:hypothetical protein DPMN_146751 [Dreissena polymorpha]
MPSFISTRLIIATPTTIAPDLDDRCGQYLQGGQALELCVTKYRIWGERNCPTTCGPCIGESSL